MSAVLPCIEIEGRRIGAGSSTYVVAELSGNHGQRFEDAVAIVRAAKAAGADAVKLQTYTPDTITIDSDSDVFQVPAGTQWSGRTLYDLYSEAFTPWEWQPELKALACELGLHCFSSPFDATAVEFLEQMDVPAYKVASFELVDLALIERIARTGKPIILSTGLATRVEIADAIRTARAAGATQLALLKCTSAYPAPVDEMNLRAIPRLAAEFGVPVGLSDHTLGSEVATAAVALGACIVEKHLTLSRNTPGPDSAFSLEPHEFRLLVDGIRSLERALGTGEDGLAPSELPNRAFRRSLFVVADVGAGELFTPENVRSIRPADGLSPRHYADVIGRRAARNIARGTPLSWPLVAAEGPGDESHA